MNPVNVLQYVPDRIESVPENVEHLHFIQVVG